ncbi:adenylosuccinate lyase [Pseudoclavibacter sp. CFCC 14310]|uniref:adenylosuccinate lyase n=1 Tax=Pseudoclavibacter sp. CFCC 14310 TaxID=2615180 RepID=UPI001300DF24|nr:adenylosuccinate lyase [Pseudoclavibacter sp. CFCC 14310]KAB1644572.1 adenylosuccinate lyase [Pseudoclavibacter sp. CFCC 14310]
MSTLDHQPLSPLDGRYQKAVSGLGEYLSEAGLNRARVHIEVEWLIFLTENGLFGTSPLTADQKAGLRALVTDFDQNSIDELAKLEAVKKHDVKSVEVFIRQHLPALGLADRAELVHIACTSEDINNLSYAVIVRDAVREVWLPKADAVVAQIAELAERYGDVPLLAHTHGQPATPTTMGKELAVFTHRLRRQLGHVREQQYLGKFNGATGTYAAHVVADPSADWPDVSRDFVEGLGLTWNPLTTQIESHDWQAELYSTVEHFNGILHNLATDFWTYISMGYFHQIPVAGEVGSSTMPHKVNPIRFENAEANLELSNALFGSLAQTLITSRMQRDLTDSTTQRNIGVAFGHSLLALDNIAKGLNTVELAAPALLDDLDHNWEVLAEAIQTVIRAEVAAGRSKIDDPYTLLKGLTRGHRIGQADLEQFVRGLDIGDEAKQRLLALRPETYIGLAPQLAKTR